MISDTDRSWWFGASDSHKVMNPNHNTKTWQEWWRVKQGIDKSDFGNIYTEAGEKFEHPILDRYDKTINKDRQIVIDDLRLRVNYDGDKDGTIYEVKTHKIENSFEITPYIMAQVQTQMFAWKHTRDDFNKLVILSYGLTKEDYQMIADGKEPTVWDIDPKRIKEREVKYKKKHIKKYLSCLKPLLEEMDELARKPSILQTEKKCFLTGYEGEGLDCHHIFFGIANRKISDENGFWVWLRHDFHIADSPNKTPHNDPETDLYLKKRCQEKYEETHSREEFIALIGRNYLD